MYTIFALDNKLQQIKKDRLKQMHNAEKAEKAAAIKNANRAKGPKKSFFAGFGKKKKPAAQKAVNVVWQWMDDSGWKNYQTDQQTKLEARYASAIPMHSA